MAVETLTLGACSLAKSQKIVAHHSDGTKRRGISIEKRVIRIAEDSGYKNVCLSSVILCRDKTSEQIVAGIVRTFHNSTKLLDGWREVAKIMFPEDEELMEEIPLSDLLDIGRLAKDFLWILTDTCNVARLFRTLFVAAITETETNLSLTPEQINIYQEDCWQHLLCVWIGAAVLGLGK